MRRMASFAALEEQINDECSEEIIKRMASLSSKEEKINDGDSEEIMKRMSKNIDISNKKVLETIEFLSLGQDEGQGSESVSVEKPNTPCNDFADSLASEAIEDAKHIVAISKKPEVYRKITISATESSSENEIKDEENKEEILEDSKCPVVEESNTTSDTKASILEWLSLSKHPKDWNDEDKVTEEMNAKNANESAKITSSLTTT